MAISLRQISDRDKEQGRNPPGAENTLLLSQVLTKNEEDRLHMNMQIIFLVL